MFEQYLDQDKVIRVLSEWKIEIDSRPLYDILVETFQHLIDANETQKAMDLEMDLGSANIPSEMVSKLDHAYELSDPFHGVKNAHVQGENVVFHNPKAFHLPDKS